MNLPIKLLGLAGIVGATAATAIAIDRRRQRRLARTNEVPVDSMADVLIVDAEIIGLDPSFK